MMRVAAFAPLLALMLLAATFTATTARSAAAPLDVIANSIQKEGATKNKSIHLTFEHGAVKDDYTLQEILPDRLHMIRSTAGHKLELIAISPLTYTRWDGGAWASSQMARSPTDMSALTGILLKGMTQVKELPATTKAGKKQRNFTAAMTWTNHGSEHRGRLSIAISSATNLPLSLAFSGTCSGAPCSFRQTFSYGSGAKIDAPIP